MDFNTLKTVIVGALSRVPAGASASDAADEIARSVQVAQQLMAGMSGFTPKPMAAPVVDSLVRAQEAWMDAKATPPRVWLDPPQAAVVGLSGPVTVHEVRPSSDGELMKEVLDSDEVDGATQFKEIVPPPRRVSAPAAIRPADFDYFDVDTIRTHLEESAPPVLEIDMGEELPLRLFRQIRPDESLKLVRLAYNPEGSQDGPYVIFSTTQEKLGLNEKMREIKDAARTRFFAGRREIKPRIQPVRSFDPASGKGGVGGDADESTMGGTELAAKWRATRSPEEDAYIHGRR